jgi:DNA-binding MarR family transcriptional regulator
MTRSSRRRQDESTVSRVRALAPVSPLVEIPEATKPALRVHLRLATCRNLLMREARRSVERWGLTLPQFDVLAELGRAVDEGFTFVELSRLLLVTSGNLTGIVDRLEGDGLVRRETDDRDRRLVRIVLTRKGRQLVEQIMPLHAQDIQALLAFMSAEKLTALTEMLGHLRDGLRHQPAGDGEIDKAVENAAKSTARARRARGRRAHGAARQSTTRAAAH